MRSSLRGDYRRRIEAGFTMSFAHTRALANRTISAEKSSAQGRMQFIERVAREFEHAGVDYVFLHESSERATDSDVDVAVSRESLSAVETVVRTGRLGQLVQRFEYDIPFCRFYIIRVDEPGRRYRQLDVGCDPWGVSRYGATLRVALEHAVNAEPAIRVPDSAATCLYLSAKRAQKGLARVEHRALIDAFRADSAAARSLLVKHFADAGRQWADELAEGKLTEQSLDRLAARLKRRPVPLEAGRLALSVIRATGRAAAPTGLAVAIVGPDGAGKSTLAAALGETPIGLFRRFAHMHLGPGILPPAGRLLGRKPGAVDRPHERAPSGDVGSVARILWLAADWTVGWLPRVTYPKVRSSLVVVERGFLDLAVDPRRYRLASGTKLVRMLSLVLPAPDLTLLVDSSPSLINERKPELSEREIDRQITTWRQLGESYRKRFAVIPGHSRTETLERAVGSIEERLVGRQMDLSRFDTALRCMGSPHAEGQHFSLVAAAGRPRWILPRRLGAVGPRKAGLYRPASLRHTVGVGLLGALQRSGGIGLRPLQFDVTDGLAGEIAAALRLRFVELAVSLPTDDGRLQRALVAVLHRGSPIAFAKVAEANSHEIKQEAAVLSALEPLRLDSIETPRLLDAFEWQGLQVTLLSPVFGRGSPSRELGRIEVRALIELAGARDRLSPVLGGSACERPQHGDFCAWNSARTRREKLALWDWEWAHAGHPLEDWYHWQTQRFLAFGRGGADELLTMVLQPNRLLDELAAELDLPKSERELGLMASLRSYESRLADDSRWQRRVILDTLAVLAGRRQARR